MVPRKRPLDKIIIEGLECKAHVGVPAWERKKLQRILIDVELSLDLRKAARTDDVRHTVDYAKVCEDLRALCRTHPFKLVEALAEQSAALILNQFPLAQSVRLRLRKFSVPGTSAVGLEITRGQ